MDVYLDAECFYSQSYSLKKMSIEEYVRDPRFEMHMLCVAIDDHPVMVVMPELIPDVLQKLHLDDPSVRVFMHNGKFDGFILAQHYGIKIANPLCTRCMGRVAGVSRICRESLAAQSEFFGHGVKGDFIVDAMGKLLKEFTPEELKAYAEYCKQDVELLRRNAKLMLPYVNGLALRFISMSLKMYLYPVFNLDKEMLEAYYAKLTSDHEASMQRLSGLFQFASTDDFLKALRSKVKFCQLLEQLGGTVPLKLSAKKTATARKKAEAEGQDPSGIEIYEPALAKNDLEFMELMSSDNPDIAALATARAECNSSMAMSRCITYLDKASRGPMPVALEAYLAHTGRYSAGTSEGVKSDASNLQNLNKRGSDKTLRKAIQVPKGMKLVACDSSQIEARVLAWLAGEQWLMQSFADKEDPYSQMASAIYGEPYERIKEWTKGKSAHDPDADPELKKKYKQYRNIGKTAVLQLGYYAGAAKFSMYLKQQGIRLFEDDATHDAEAQRIVQVYRNRNVAIRTFWKTCEHVINQMLAGQSGVFGGPKGMTLRYDGAYDLFGHKVAAVTLPDGYKLFYPNLRMETVDGRPEVVYDLMEKGRIVTKRIHAGVLCNNCIAEGTLVLTDKGWLPIETITPNEKVWDGTCFVEHKGVVCNGTQTCIEVNGVYMTPDHLVLQGNTWRTANETVRPDRANIWEADCDRTSAYAEETDQVVRALRVWRGGDSCRARAYQGTCAASDRAVLQEVPEGVSEVVTFAPRHGADTVLRSMAEHDEPLLQRVGACLQKLRGTWHQGLRALAQVRELSRRYVGKLCAWLDYRTFEQRGRLLCGELCVGTVSEEYAEPSAQLQESLPGNGTTTWHKAFDNSVQDSAGLARRQALYTTRLRQCETQVPRTGSPTVQKKVFDIQDCGERHRFVVLGDYPFTVHNCTQGLAFAIIRLQALVIDQRYPVRINIHDSLGVVVPEEEAEQCKGYMLTVMQTSPAWAKGLCLGAEAEIGNDFTVA